MRTAAYREENEAPRRLPRTGSQRRAPPRTGPPPITGRIGLQTDPMKTLLLFAVAAAAASCGSPSQYPVQFGAEFQAYPAGIIVGPQIRQLISDTDAVILRVAVNSTDRNDWGEHDDESGSGVGVGLGWRHALTESIETTGWLIGARADIWSLEIDWKEPGPRTGTTDIIVLQPTVECGYGWTYEDGGRLEAMLGLGAEINVHTDGEDVGEGAIVLFGLNWLL